MAHPLPRKCPANVMRMPRPTVTMSPAPSCATGPSQTVRLAPPAHVVGSTIKNLQVEEEQYDEASG